MKLHFIPWISLLAERLQKFPDVVLDQQRAAQDAHDFDDGTSQLEVVFKDSDEAICDDGNMYLYTYGILRSSPKGLDAEVLLDPFEEQLNLPAILVQQGNVLGGKLEVVRVVCEGPMQLWSVINDAPEREGVILLVPLSCEPDRLVTKDIVRAFREVFPVFDSIIGMELLTYDEERSRLMDGEESCEVKVASVKHIAGQRLIGKPVHSIDIVQSGGCDSIEYGNLRNDVNLCMDLDAGLGLSELRPTEYGQAKVNGRGVHGIEPAVQLKRLCDALALCNGDHVKGKLLKDAVVPEVVGPGQHLTVDGLAAEAEKERFPTMGERNICKFPQSTATLKLAEHKNQQLAPMAQRPAAGMVVVLDNKTPELPLREELCYLSENIMTYMHNCACFESAAKIANSKVGHAFLKIKRCA